MFLQLQNNQRTIDINEWTYNISPLKKRIGVNQKYGQSGAWPLGDGKISSRSIQLSHDLASETDESYLSQLENIIGIFYDDYSPFYLIDSDRNIRTRVDFDNISETWTKGIERRLVNITINLIALDSFFEDNFITAQTFLNVADNDTNIFNNASLIDVFPVLTVIALADVPEFSIINQTTEDTITIASNIFTTGNVITIDNINGKVLLSDGITEIDISYAVADGTGFFFLDIGNNTIEYQSLYGNVDIKIEYRPKYLF